MKKQVTGFEEYLQIAAGYMGEFGTKFDIKAVEKFMESCHKSEPVSLADAQQVTILLEAIIHAAKNSSAINLSNKFRELFEIPQQTEKRYAPADIAPGTEVHQAVVDYFLDKVNGISLADKRTRKTTSAETVKKVGGKLFVGKREARRVIAKIRNDILPSLYEDTEEHD